MATNCGIVRLVPGPQGIPGAAGTNGSDGTSAFTTTTAIFTMPAEGATADAVVMDSSMVAPGQVIYLQNAGWLQVTAVPDGITITLKNIEDTAAGTYADNVAPATAIAVGSKLVASGPQGPAGTNGTGGAPTTASYLTRQAEAGLSAEFNLGSLTTGMLKHTVAASVSTPATATDGTDYLSPTTGLAKSGNLAGLANTGTSRTNLGLGSIATQDASAVAITGGAISGITDLALADGGTGASTAAAARANLGVLSGYGLLGYIIGWDANSATTDTAFTMLSSRYIIDRITLDNASTSLTTATGGVFTAAGGGGVTLAADQSLAALTATTKFKNLTLQAIAGTDVTTAGTLYMRDGTAQGSAATADVRVYGWKLD